MCESYCQILLGRVHANESVELIFIDQFCFQVPEGCSSYYSCVLVSASNNGSRIQPVYSFRIQSQTMLVILTDLACDGCMTGSVDATP